MQKCNTCGGTYAPILPDGMRYFHACPPLHRVRVKHQDGTTAVVDVDKVVPTDERLEDVFVERADKRDENVMLNGAGTVKPKAEGKGTTTV